MYIVTSRELKCVCDIPNVDLLFFLLVRQPTGPPGLFHRPVQHKKRLCGVARTRFEIITQAAIFHKTGPLV